MFSFARSIKISFVLVAVAALLIFLHYVGVLIPLENAAIRFFAPVQRPLYAAGAGLNGWYERVVSGKDVREENKQLKEQVLRLTVENAQLTTLLDTQKELLIQKNFLDAMGLRAASARIIGRNPEANLKAIIIDKGSNEGIQEGFPVITSNGIIIGKVSSVTSRNAEVVLVNDSRSRIAGTIKDREISQGVVLGEHGLSLKMELILKNEPIAEGDVIVTSGIEPNIPPGLVVGTVSRIETEANSFSQTAWIQPLIDVNKVITVSVLTP